MTPQLAFALGFLAAVAVAAIGVAILALLMRDIVTPPTANPTTASWKVTLTDMLNFERDAWLEDEEE